MLKTILRELYRLFVDDGNLALAVVIWLALAWFALPRLPLGSWAGAVLVAGLAAILVESVWRRTRNRPKRRRRSGPDSAD